MEAEAPRLDKSRRSVSQEECRTKRKAAVMFGRLFHSEQSAIPSIDTREAWTRLTQPGSSAVLIDVREAWEYRRGHARGAINIPLSQLQARISEVPQDREVLLICQSGHRSMQAAHLLQRQGVQRVVNVKGGTALWRLHGLPVE
jgi:rhodanese-related sulfurtransferase